MDTETDADTPWAVLLSCGHVFHQHCAVECLKLKGECPTCRAKCRPDQAQRLFINNAVPAETPESMRDGSPRLNRTATFQGKYGRDSAREPLYECSLYPKVMAGGTASGPSNRSVPGSSVARERLSGADRWAADPGGYDYGISSSLVGSGTNNNTRSRGQQGNRQAYVQYQTIAYDPYYSNQPKMIVVKRRQELSREAQIGIGLGAAALGCLFCCSVM